MYLHQEEWGWWLKLLYKNESCTFANLSLCLLHLGLLHRRYFLQPCLCVPASVFQGCHEQLSPHHHPGLLPPREPPYPPLESGVIIRYPWPAKSQGWGEWHESLSGRNQAKTFLGFILQLNGQRSIAKPTHVTASPRVIWIHMEFLWVMSQSLLL